MEVKTKKTRWYRGVSELFSGVDVEANFYNGIHVKGSKREREEKKIRMKK